MKPDPYKRQASRRYQAKVRGRGGSAAPARGGAGRGRGRGRGGGARANLGSNAFRFEDENEGGEQQPDEGLGEKELLRLVEDVLDANRAGDAFFRLKDELDWGNPGGGGDAGPSELDFVDIDYALVCEMINRLPLEERYAGMGETKGEAARAPAI